MVHSIQVQCTAPDKMGFPQYIIFLFVHKNIHCGYSLEVPQQGTFNEYPQRMSSLTNKKNISTFQLKKKGILSRAMQCITAVGFVSVHSL